MFSFFSLRRFIGYLSLLSYIFGLLSPTLAQIPIKEKPLVIPTMDKGVFITINQLEQKTHDDVLPQLSIKMDKTPPTSDAEDDTSPLHEDHLSWSNTSHEVDPENLSDDDPSKKSSDTHQTSSTHAAKNDDFYEDVSVGGKQYKSSKKVSSKAISIINEIVSPGLKDVDYNLIQELYQDAVSVGVSWYIEHVGSFHLLWDGSAFLVGNTTEQTKSERPSLELNLLTSLHVSNVDLKALSVHGAEVYFSENNIIDHLHIMHKSEDQKGNVTIDQMATLKTTLFSTDQALDNKGHLSFFGKGRLEVKDNVFVNQGHVNGDDSLLIDGLSFFENEGQVNLPFLRLHAHDIDNKGIINVDSAHIESIDGLLNRGNIQAKKDLILKASQTIENTGTIKGKNVELEAHTVVNKASTAKGEKKPKKNTTGSIRASQKLQITFQKECLNEGSIKSDGLLDLVDNLKGTLTNHGLIETLTGKLFVKNIHNGDSQNSLHSIVFKKSISFREEASKRTNVNNKSQFFIGNESQKASLNRFQNSGNFVSESHQDFFIHRYKHSGTSSFKGNLSIESGENRGEMSIAGDLSVTKDFSNKHNMAASSIRGDGRLTNSGLLDLTQSTSSSLFIKNFINRGKVEGNALTIASSNTIFKNEEKGVIAVKEFILQDNQSLLFWINEGLIQSDTLIFHRKKVQNEGCLVAKALTILSEHFTNDHSGEIEAHTLSMTGQTLDNRGTVSIRQNLSGTIHNITNTGTMTIKGDVDVKGDTLKNTHTFHVGNAFTYTGRHLVNGGEFRVNKLKIFLKEQFLNRKNFQILSGNIQAWHILNTGVLFYGETFKTAFPEFTPKEKPASFEFKHGTGLENYGLIRLAKERAQLSYRNESLRNSGDLDVRIFRTTAKSFINTKTATASFKKVTMDTPSFENEGAFNVSSTIKSTHKRMITKGTMNIKGKAQISTDTWDQSGKFSAHQAHLTLKAKTLNNKGHMTIGHLMVNLDHLNNHKTFQVLKKLTGRINHIDTHDIFVVGERDKKKSVVASKDFTDSLVIESLINWRHCFFFETEKPLDLTIKRVYNGDVLSFSSNHQKTSIKKLDNAGTMIINVLSPFYVDTLINKKETIIENAPLIAEKIVNKKKGIISLQGNDQDEWIIREKKYNSKPQPSHAIVTPVFKNKGKIECTGSLDCSSDLVDGEIAVKDDLFYHFYGKSITGLELENTTVEGVLYVNANDLVTLRKVRLEKINNVKFFLKEFAEIDNTIYVNGLSINAGSYVDIKSKLNIGRKGSDIKAEAICITEGGHIESKGDINLQAKESIIVGESEKKLWEDFNCHVNAPNGTGLLSEKKISLKSRYINLSFGTIQANSTISYEALEYIDHIAALTQSLSDIIINSPLFYHAIEGFHTLINPHRTRQSVDVHYDYPHSVQSILHAAGRVSFTGKQFGNLASIIIAERGSTIKSSHVYCEENLLLNADYNDTPKEILLMASFLNGKTAHFHLGRGFFGGMIRAEEDLNIKALDHLSFENICKERNIKTTGSVLFDVTDFANHFSTQFKYTGQTNFVPSFDHTGGGPKQQVHATLHNPYSQSNNYSKRKQEDMLFASHIAMHIGRIPVQSLINKIFSNTRQWSTLHRQTSLTYEDLEQLDKTIVYTSTDDHGRKRLILAVPATDMNAYRNPGDFYAGKNMTIISQGDIECRNTRHVGRFGLKMHSGNIFYGDTGKYTTSYGTGFTVIHEERSHPKLQFISPYGNTDIGGDQGVHIGSADLGAGESININSKKGDVTLEGQFLNKTATTVDGKNTTTNTTTMPDPVTLTAGDSIHVTSNTQSETYAANAHLRAGKKIHWSGGHTVLDTQVGYNVTNSTSTHKKVKTQSKTSTPVFAGVDQEAGEDILFDGEKATIFGGKVKATKFQNRTKKGMTIEPKVATKTHTVHNEKKGLFGTQKSGGNQWQEVMDQPIIDADVVDTQDAPLHLDSVVVDEEKTTFLGEYTKTTRTLKSGGSTYAKATGIFNPGIAAVVALGIGLATQGWGQALAGALDLGATATTIFSAGITTMCAKTGMSLVQNDLNLKDVARDVVRKDTLLNVLEDMGTAVLLANVPGMGQVEAKEVAELTRKNAVEGFAKHFQRGLVKAGAKAVVHNVVEEGVRKRHIQRRIIIGDVIVRGMVEGVGGVGANIIGNAYEKNAIDPVLHKVLHGALGGLTGGMLNGKDGAKAGVISAMIAESLGDLVRAQSKETFPHLREQYPDDEDYNTHVEAYLLQQKDLLLLATAGITTGLGLDVDTAIDVADNALTHNWLQGMLLALDAASIGLDLYEEDLQENRETVIDFLAENTSYDRKDIAEAVDHLVVAGRIVCQLSEVVSQISGRPKLAKVAAQGIKKGVKPVKLTAPGGAIRQEGIVKGSKIEYMGPGKVKFDGVEFRAVRDLGHLDEGTLRKMMRKGLNPEDIKGIRLDGHHHKQRYHRDPGAFMVEIPEKNHKIGNPLQHPHGNIKGGGLTHEERLDWKKLRKDFNKERARNELIRRGLIDGQ